VPPAPGLLSTITVCFRIVPICWPTERATTSVEPAGANGTTQVIVLLGQVSAKAVAVFKVVAAIRAAGKCLQRVMACLFEGVGRIEYRR
jgi:hypothetical protein